MKREIKFRGKGITNNEWVYGYIIYWEKWDEEKQKWTEHYGIVSDSWCNMIPNDCIEVIHETIGQFTGLTDKNGNDIYENDIFSTHYGSNYTVEFYQKYCLYSLCRPIGRIASYPFLDSERGEVIGNIYDNPQLVNEAT